MSKADPIVEACVEALLKSLSIGKNAVHDVDKSKAKEMFKALRKKGFALDHDAIYQQAIAHDWLEKDAKALAKMAADIDSGKRPVIKRPTDWGKSTVDRIIAEHQ